MDTAETQQFRPVHCSLIFYDVNGIPAQLLGSTYNFVHATMASMNMDRQYADYRAFTGSPGPRIGVHFEFEGDAEL